MKIEPTEKAHWERMRDGDIDKNGNIIDETYQVTANPREITDVRIVHIELPFWNIVMFMVTAVLASIPAMIILAIMIATAMALTGGLAQIIADFASNLR